MGRGPRERPSYHMWHGTIESIHQFIHSSFHSSICLSSQLTPMQCIDAHCYLRPVNHRATVITPTRRLAYPADCRPRRHGMQTSQHLKASLGWNTLNQARICSAPMPAIALTNVIATPVSQQAAAPQGLHFGHCISCTLPVLALIRMPESCKMSDAGKCLPGKTSMSCGQMNAFLGQLMHTAHSPLHIANHSFLFTALKRW